MPNSIPTYRGGEIWWINLDPTVGSEAQKTRACLIVQNDIGNRIGPRTIIMPFLPGTKSAPYVVNVSATKQNGLDKNRYIDVGQIRSVDHRRVLNKLGILEPQYWDSIRKALDVVLGFLI